MNLSKSRYCSGLQCPKILWLNQNKPEVYDPSVLNEAVLEQGNVVGDLAMGYFGDYTEAPYNKDKSVMLAETKRLLAAGCKTICEASFAFANNFCSVDILRVFDGYVEITEVKSSTAGAAEDGVDEKTDSQVKDVYLHDMAFQYYVLSGAGLTVKKTTLLQLNRTYIREGDIDLQELFIAEDCTDRVLNLQQGIKSNLDEINAVADIKTESEKEIGMQCIKPYLCGFKEYCWRHIPPNSVFDINGISMHWDMKFDRHARGITTFEQLLESGEKLNDSTLLQVRTEVERLPSQIVITAVRDFLQTISYPVYHLDFETFMPAIPPYNGTRPYSQIPFQYSLHIQEKPGADPIHKEFLAKEGTDPRRTLAERLCADIPQNVCTIAWNMSFEKGRIMTLAKTFPDLSEHLMNIHDRIVDLIVPFRSHYYYDRGFKGRSSIKLVLPALFPDDPELDYKALHGIHNGGEAMNAFLDLHKKTPEEIAETRADLLAYCRLDTLAMVKILDKLHEVTAV
ncbi:hypothetical protein FACS1894147_06160 [Spirochaetia bacterium]|nr:hypothetical protein FACS1894147_06160 [Spirochaetia bacterium]